MDLNHLKKWWQVKTGRLETPFDSIVPFWLVSLIFHLALLVLLARIFFPSPESRLLRLESDEIVDQELSPEIPPFDISDLIEEDLGVDQDLMIEIAMDQAIFTDPMETQESLDSELTENEFGEIFRDLAFEVATAEIEETTPVIGTVGSAALGASGAVDKITQDILRSLEQRPTVVAWLFDQSTSMISQRGEIQARFSRIYEEVDILKQAGHTAFSGHESRSPLLTQVYGFGVGFNKLTSEPTDDIELIKQMIARIERDETGIENVMQAVINVAGDLAPYRTGRSSSDRTPRNVMIIIVSDEAGDDVRLTDDAIRICNRHQIPVSVIGIPAPFGRPETFLKWVDPDPEYDQSEQWAVISQGPESMMPERLRIDLTGDFEDLEAIDSGFGPFHLTRLCLETGGTYFAVHPNRRTSRAVSRREVAKYAAHLRYFFDPEIMRHYRPDYVTEATYTKRLQANPSRQALVQAATYTTTGRLESPRLRFPNFDEARFVNDVTMAQRTAAIVEPQINRVYEMLRMGEEARPKEASLRWQAGYDLAMGQAIAAKLRAESYNGMLALVKTRLKFDPPKNENTPQNNTWVLRPADNIETGSQAQRLMDKAKTYLQRVAKEHPGTPWAMLAEKELATPMGWEWTQTYTPPPQPRQPRSNNNNNNNQRPPDQPRENQMPPPLRPPPRL